LPAGEQANFVARECAGDPELLAEVAGVLRADAQLHLDNHDRADRFLAEALAIRERVLDPEHPDLAISYHSLAKNFDHQGRRDEPRAFYERALELRRRVLGAQHPDVAGTLTNLSTLEYRMGDLEAALARPLEALAIYREAVADIGNVANAVGTAGVMPRDLGRYGEARPKLEESLAMKRNSWRHAYQCCRSPHASCDARPADRAAFDRGKSVPAGTRDLRVEASRRPYAHRRRQDGLGAALLLRERASRR
jgi:tetratricopeptide (TPR) repeat protein